MKVKKLGDGLTDIIELLKKAGIQTDWLNLASQKNYWKIITFAENL